MRIMEKLIKDDLKEFLSWIIPNPINEAHSMFVIGIWSFWLYLTTGNQMFSDLAMFVPISFAVERMRFSINKSKATEVR